jgi:hypothetical protein
MQYKIRGLAGISPTVSFRCAKCRAALNAPLEEAGEILPCPGCESQLSVPGGDELAHWTAERAEIDREENKRLAEREAAQRRKPKAAARSAGWREADAGGAAPHAGSQRLGGLTGAHAIAAWLHRHTSAVVVVYVVCLVATLWDFSDRLHLTELPFKLGFRALVYMLFIVVGSAFLLWLLLFAVSTLCLAACVLVERAEAREAA